MKKLLLGLICFQALYCAAQKDKAIAYIQQYKDIAIQEMIRSGVPAAITLAQGVLESQFGESDLCKKSNNHFGIKCKNEWTGEKVYHDDDAAHECFRSYPTAAESYKDHSDFLKNREYYSALFLLQPTDAEGWAKGLKAAGYATEKDYPQKLMKLINEYDLNQYTLIALEQKDKPAIENIAKAEVKAAVDTARPVVAVAAEPIAPKIGRQDTVAVKALQGPPVMVVNPYPTGVFSINNTSVIFAVEGTSLLQIASEHHISLANLLDFNDMEGKEILEKGALIFLERKPKKGDKDFHVAAPNETLQEVSQAEGVRLESVMEYNGFKNKVQPTGGEKIYLRYPAPYTPKVAANPAPTNKGSR